MGEAVQLVDSGANDTRDLAARFELSRTPVREALIRLVDEGLVHVYPQRGTFVSRIRATDVRDAQFVRQALECAALPDAVKCANDDDIRSLRELLTRQDQAVKAGDSAGFFKLDEDFHAALMDIGGHGSAWQVVVAAKAHLDRARRLSLSIGDTDARNLRQHGRIVAAIVDHDADAGSDALWDHLRRVLDDIHKIRELQPDSFE